MWVIFEGLDKTGKGTLEKEFCKATNYEHVIIDRGPVGYIIYDHIFGRVESDRIINFTRQIQQINMSCNSAIIHCHADESEVNERLKKHGEHQIDFGEGTYNNYSRMYKASCGWKYRNSIILFIDTTNKAIKECVGEIVEFVEKVRCDNEHKQC